MSEFNADAQAEDAFNVLKQFLNLEGLIQDAYDQGVVDTLGSANASISGYFD